jgi:hypothetical protein
MTVAIILVVFAAIALVSIAGFAVSRSLQASNGPRIGPRIQPVDVEAFRNLVNPAEDDHLRRRLPPAEFRQVRRERLRAAAAYVLVARRNAVILARSGRAAENSNQPQTVEAAARLVDQARRLKRNTSVALFRIYVALAWPNDGLAAAPVLEGYRSLSGTAMLLGRLQNPGSPVRISA